MWVCMYGWVHVCVFVHMCARASEGQNGSWILGAEVTVRFELPCVDSRNTILVVRFLRWNYSTYKFKKTTTLKQANSWTSISKEMLIIIVKRAIIPKDSCTEMLVWLVTISLCFWKLGKVCFTIWNNALIIYLSLLFKYPYLKILCFIL